MGNTFEKKIPYKKAICYSGYREGQSPSGEIPSREQISEDLNLLVADGYGYIRMYEPNAHAITALQVIREEKLPLQCMIGIDSMPEINSPEFYGGPQNYSEEELAAHAASNDAQLDKLISLANEYTDEIIAVSVGNENRFPFVGHLVSEERLVFHAKKLHTTVKQPVAFCEVDVDWENLKSIADEIDVIGIHTYPYHMDVPIESAMQMTKESFENACAIYPNKQICFTEAGWTTSTSHDDHAGYASVANQKRYLTEFAEYLEKEQIVGFIFEAFDELWKDPSSPAASECNWGVYDINRKKKW